MALPLVLLIDQPRRLVVPGAVVWGSLIGLELLSKALAWIIFFRLIATAGATNTSRVILLIPVSAILLWVTFLGEHLPMSQLGGMGLIGLGCLALDGRVLGTP